MEKKQFSAFQWKLVFFSYTVGGNVHWTSIARGKLKFVTKAFIMFVLFDKTLPFPNNQRNKTTTQSMHKDQVGAPPGFLGRSSFFRLLWVSVLWLTAAPFPGEWPWACTVPAAGHTSPAPPSPHPILGPKGGPRGRQCRNKNKGSQVWLLVQSGPTVLCNSPSRVPQEVRLQQRPRAYLAPHPSTSPEPPPSPHSLSPESTSSVCHVITISSWGSASRKPALEGKLCIADLLPLVNPRPSAKSEA